MKNKNLNNEIIISCYFVKKSSSSLVEDLKYFNDCFNKFYESFSVEQSVSILGQIEEVEQNIDKVKDILTKKILS